jgi:hypothetical protein
MNIGEDRINNFRSLTEFSNHGEALNLLKKIASHVTCNKTLVFFFNCFIKVKKKKRKRKKKSSTIIFLF